MTFLFSCHFARGLQGQEGQLSLVLKESRERGWVHSHLTPYQNNKCHNHNFYICCDTYLTTTSIIHEQSLVPPVSVSHGPRVAQTKKYIKHVLSPQGLPGISGRPGAKVRGQLCCVLALLFVFMCLAVKLVLLLFFRETQVNQERGGKMDGQESRESLVWLGKRSEWCLGSGYIRV